MVMDSYSEPAESAPQVAAPADNGVSEADAAYAKSWCDKIKAAKEHPKTKKAFERMRVCMEIAARGGDKSWTASDDRYVVPILNRYISVSVSKLYAKNPTATWERRKRRMYKVWDGKWESLDAAAQEVLGAMQPQVDPMTGMALPAPQPSPNSIALLMEVAAVDAQESMIDGLGETMEILHAYFMSEQASNYKSQYKALVRRAKTCGVGYVKLGFQRMMERRPEIAAQINDHTEELRRLDVLMQQAQDGKIEEHTAKAGELKAAVETLQSQLEIILREGPVLDFPRATEVIVDPACRHLETFTGARWIAQEFDLTHDEVKEIYDIDLKGKATAYKAEFVGGDDKDKIDDLERVKVYEVQYRSAGQFFTVCDGYKGFLKPPAAPDVDIERFWTIFPLIFNEVESEEELYPIPDVWQARHSQDEYNRSRQGLREHRIASLPKYFVSKGALEVEDKTKLATAAAHEIIELNALTPGQSVDSLIQPLRTVGVDPNLYEVNMHYQDVMRSLGAQEATFGGTSDETATAAAITENVQSTDTGYQVDALDDHLSDVARSMGELMLVELSTETVEEIVGPGYIWPAMPQTREELRKELMLSVKAGSSGRPNAAAELAKLERAAPYLFQLPNINPTPIVRKYLELLDMDLDATIKEGLPSVQALNQMMGRPPTAGIGVQGDPMQQGATGAQNAPVAPQNEPGGQPAFPAPEQGNNVPVM